MAARRKLHLGRRAWVIPILALMGILMGGWSARRAAPPLPTTTPMPFVMATPELTSAGTPTPIPPYTLVSPDRRYTVEIASTTAGAALSVRLSRNGRILRTLDTEDVPVQILDEMIANRAFQFSPDSRLFLTDPSSRYLLVWSLRSGVRLMGIYLWTGGGNILADAADRWAYVYQCSQLSGASHFYTCGSQVVSRYNMRTGGLDWETHLDLWTINAAVRFGGDESELLLMTANCTVSTLLYDCKEPLVAAQFDAETGEPLPDSE